MQTMSNMCTVPVEMISFISDKFVEPQATDGVCPSFGNLDTVRNADCRAVKLTEAPTADTCNSDYCCWYADTSKCYAKNKPGLRILLIILIMALN